MHVIWFRFRAIRRTVSITEETLSAAQIVWDYLNDIEDVDMVSSRP